MGSVVIRTAGIEDLEVLLQWRMEVLQNVFALPEKPSEGFRKLSAQYETEQAERLIKSSYTPQGKSTEETMWQLRFILPM